MNPDLRVYESDKAWIARGGHLGCQLKGFENGLWKQEGINDRSNQGLLPEHHLWSAVIDAAITDAIGRSGPLLPPEERNCVECHLDQDCACLSYRFTWAEVTKGLWIRAKKPSYFVYIPKTKKEQFGSNSYKRPKLLYMSPVHIWERPDGTWLYKVLSNHCKFRHDDRACALKFLESEWITTICELTGLEPRTVRMEVAKRVEAYCNSGLSSQARGSNGAPEVGG